MNALVLSIPGLDCMNPLGTCCLQVWQEQQTLQPRSRSNSERTFPARRHSRFWHSSVRTARLQVQSIAMQRRVRDTAARESKTLRIEPCSPDASLGTSSSEALTSTSQQGNPCRKKLSDQPPVLEGVAQAGATGTGHVSRAFLEPVD